MQEKKAKRFKLNAFESINALVTSGMKSVRLVVVYMHPSKKDQNATTFHRGGHTLDIILTRLQRAQRRMCGAAILGCPTTRPSSARCTSANRLLAGNLYHATFQTNKCGRLMQESMH